MRASQIVSRTLLVIALTLPSCTSRVEIPNDKVAIVFNNDTGIQDSVLNAGAHSIHSDDQIILFPSSSQQITLTFDFIFNDADPGNITFSMTYTPIIEKLPMFYKQYESNHMSQVVEVEVRSLIRNLLEAYNNGDLTGDGIQEQIVKEMKSEHEILSYIIVQDMSSFEIRF